MNGDFESGQSGKQSLRKLKRSAALGTVTALMLFLVVVLPAEFGADPTGLGQVLGLKRMGEIKRELTAVSEDVDATTDHVIDVTSTGRTRIRLVLRPYRGREVKAWMNKGATMRFDWSSNGEAVEYEFHGDTGNPKNLFVKSYEQGTRINQAGTFVAGFTGRHGWYWHNLKSKPVLITVNAEGEFNKIEPVE